MKNLMCIVLILTIFTSVLSGVVFAADTDEGFLIFSVEIKNEECVLTGRAVGESEKEINVACKKSGAATQNYTAVSGVDEIFTVSFPMEYALYTIELSCDSGNKSEFEYDFSVFEGIFNLGSGYEISGISIKQSTIVLSGNHNEATYNDVTMRIMDPTLDDELGLKSIGCVKGNENGDFSFRFKLASGEYDFYLLAGDAQCVSCRLIVPEFISELRPEENVYDVLIRELVEYVRILEELISKCEDKNISCDYEKAYLEIIRKFIDYITREAEAGKFTRMKQYEKNLTDIFTEARQNLNDYLEGKKTPFDVPRMITDGSLKFDGTTMISNTIFKNEIVERPVFLTGWGHFNTPLNEQKLFTDLGFNFTQFEINWNNILSPVKGDGWRLDIYNQSDGYIGTTNKESVSGNYSIKMSKPTPESKNVFRELIQEIKVKPKTRYILKFKAKGKGITDGAAWVDFSKNTWGTTRYRIVNSDDWKEYQYEILTGADVNEYHLILFVGGIAEEVYVDDVSVSEKGSNAELAVNGGFDEDEPLTAIEEKLAKYGCYINWDKLEEIEEKLKLAEQHNILVDVPLGPNFIPDYVLATDPSSTAASAYFLPFALDNETVLDVLSIYVQLLAPIINKYNSVRSVCLTNEPKVYAWSNDYYKPKWYKYLENQYVNISELNKVYGTGYTSFSEVDWPKWDYSPHFNDYIHFNDSLLCGFHNELVEEMRRYCPDIKVYAKYIGYFQKNYNSQFQRGVDYEPMADVMDINGCDGVSTYEQEFTLLNRMGWYDLMQSMAEKPIWDTEHHTFVDSGEIFDDDIVEDYMDADLWNGAIHGRSGSVLWLWEDVRTTGAFDNTNAKRRPDMLKASVKVNFDLNRLSNEIVALQKEKAKVGIIYSRTSLAYNSNHSVSCVDAYEECLMNGQKVRFITDSNPETLHNYDLVIVPDATHVKADMLGNIKEYAENGGNILLIGENALARDYYGRNADSSVLGYIRQKADISSNVKEKIEELNLSEIKLIDVDTGRTPEDVEWTYTQYGDKYLVNIMNYNQETSRKIKVLIGDEKINGYKELRSGYEYTTGDINIEPYKPILISFDSYTFDLIDETGSVKEENIYGIKPGIMKCNNVPKGTLMIALYKDNTLIAISVGTGEINIPVLKKGNYSLKIVDWDISTMTPLAVAGCRKTEVE